MNIVCTFAKVVGVAHNKNHNSFLAHGGKKVAHHCCGQSFGIFILLLKDRSKHICNLLQTKVPHILELRYISAIIHRHYEPISN